MAAIDFFSLYEGTVTIDLGRNFHAVIRKYLSEVDYRHAQEELLTEKEYHEPGLGMPEVSAKVNTGAYHRALVLAALVSWNITDANGEVQIDSESVGRLPQHVFNKILKRVLELNNADDNEATADADPNFRSRAAGSDKAARSHQKPAA